jgi:hypothetical protein
MENLIMKSLPKFACVFAAFVVTGSMYTAPAEIGFRGTPYTRCTEGPAEQSIATDANGAHTPDFDEICKYPSSSEARVYENRCSDAQKVNCEGQAPTLTNPRDVPNGGTFWFFYPGSAGVPPIRCLCD